MKKIHNGNTLFFSKNASIREIHNTKSAEAFSKLFEFLKENNLDKLKRTAFESEIIVSLPDIIKAISADCNDCDQDLHLVIRTFLENELKIDLHSIAVDCDMITIAFIDHENINMDMKNSIDESELLRYKNERNNLNNIIQRIIESNNELVLAGRIPNDVDHSFIEYLHNQLVDEGKNIDPEVSMEVVES